MTLLLLQSGPGKQGVGGGGPPPPDVDTYLANVVLLMSFNGADAAVNGPGMTDESPKLHGTAGVTGGAQIDTAQSVFGGSSLLLDGSSYIAFPDSGDFDLASVQYTIECWIRPTIVSGGHDIIGQWADLTATSGWVVSQNADGLQLNISTTGTDDVVQLSAASVLAANAWHAVAVDFDGAKYRLYVNGAMVASSTTLHTVFNSPYFLSIGGTLGIGFQGWIDELRITRGVARYHSDSGYTVPSSPYPRPPTTLTLSNSYVDKAATAGTTIGTLLVINGTGTYTYSLTSNPGSLFAISGSNLNVAATLTGGTKPISVRASGGTPSPVDQNFTISVAELLLSGATIAEDVAIGTVIGALSVANGTGSYSYSITSDPSSLFAISGSNLATGAALAHGSYPITVTATGGLGAAPSPISQSFMLTVTAVSLTLSGSSVTDTAAIGTTVGTLSVAGGTGSYSYSLTSNPGGLFAISGSSLNVAATLTAGTKPITVQATGGGPVPITANFSIIVTVGVTVVEGAWFNGLPYPGIEIAGRDAGSMTYWFNGLPMPIKKD